MSWWSRDIHEGAGNLDLAYPPDSGGPLKQVALGFCLAGYLVYLPVSIWIHEYAWLPARHGRGEVLQGDSARAMAFVSLGAALFCHARWFWGSRKGFYWTFERLTILAALLMIGGMAGVFWFELFD